MSRREKPHRKNATAKIQAVKDFTKNINGLSFNSNGKISNSVELDEIKSKNKQSDDRILS